MTGNNSYHHIVMMIIAIFRSLFNSEYEVLGWIADLADDNLDNAGAAARKLGESGDLIAVNPLLAALKWSVEEAQEPTDNPHLDAARVDFRQDVVRALGKLGDQRAANALQDISANDPDAGVRNEAESALRQIEKGHYPPLESDIAHDE